MEEEEMLTSPGTRSPRGRRSYVRTRRNSRPTEEVEAIEQIDDEVVPTPMRRRNSNARNVEMEEEQQEPQDKRSQRQLKSEITEVEEQPIPKLPPPKPSPKTSLKPLTGSPSERARIRERPERVRRNIGKEEETDEKPNPLQSEQLPKNQDQAVSILESSRVQDDKAPPLTKEIPMSTFMVMITGAIESCQFAGIDELCCKYHFVFGDDWTYISGMDRGITQRATKSIVFTEDRLMVWNFPLELTLKSSNPYGWPQLAVSIYGPDWAGREVIRGYGTARLPIATGSYVKYIRLWKPVASNYFQELVSIMSGQRTEYNDPKFVTKGEGRKVTRVISEGIIKVRFNVLTKGMSKFGFSETPFGVSTPIIY